MDKDAHFHRCDFQVHSPRNLAWKGSSYFETDNRKAYAETVIKACREKGIDAVAITDHHDLCFFKYFRDATTNEKKENCTETSKEDKIIVFLGLELTLNIPYQAIVILDSNFPDTLLGQVFTVLAITPTPDPEEKTAKVQRLDAITTLEQFNGRAI